MNMESNQDFFFPGLELMSLTGDDDVNEYADDDDEPMIDWLDDSEIQENLFQIISLTPEEARCDKDNHIIQSDAHHMFFEEIGYFCQEPEPLDPTMDYEAEYKERMNRQQLLKKGRPHHRQQHVELESAADPVIRMHPILSPCPSIDAAPGLSSSSSSFHQTDDDHSEEDDCRSPRLLHLNHPSPISKPVLPTHFSFTTARF